MYRNRLEAFSDGVIAIIITIMVLQLNTPTGTNIESLKPLLPKLLSYIMSFIYIAIYWNNHHHLIHTIKNISSGILWSNTHLLFWLSLVPWVTAWTGEHYVSELPVAAYSFVLFMAAVAYYILTRTIIASHGKDSILATAIGNDLKGKISVIFYAIGIGFAYINTWISILIIVLIALLWLYPDRRIEKQYGNDSNKNSSN